MYHTVSKLTALAAVVGIGVGVVVHAQRGMQDSQDNNEVAANQQQAGDATDDANPPSQDLASDDSLPDQGSEADLLAMDNPGRKATPAAAKMSGDSNRPGGNVNPGGIVKTSGVRSLNDTEFTGKATGSTKGRAAASSDPFEMSDDESESEPPPARLSTKSQAASSRGKIDIVDVADDEDEADLDEPKQVEVATTNAKPQSRPRAPVLTLDGPDAGEPDADESDRPDAETDAGSNGKSGPRLLGATDDMSEDAPPRATSRPPAARIVTDDPFADEDSADSGKKTSRVHAYTTADLDDEEFAPRNRTPQKKAQDVTEPDEDRTPQTARPNNSPREQPPAELGRTIEVDAAADDETSVPSKPELPQITIEKIAPATAVLGRPMIYQILVRNVGHNAAHQVVVEDVVPPEVKIDGSIPQAVLKDNRLIWKLGTLPAGQEKKISVRVIPQSEGSIGGVATVNFAAEPQPSPTAASPQLKFDVAAPRQAAVGTPVEFNFRVRNTGQVPASGVTIRNVLPAGLRHPDGDDLEYEIGALPAGKTREVKLVLTAAQAGPTVNRVVVTADGNVAEEAQVQLDVVGPTLLVVRDGPKRLFPNKTGTYTNTVTNPGLSQVSNVSVVETVPPGMEFVEASDGGKYNAAKRSVTWTIGQIVAAASKTVKVTLKSNARGAQVSVVRAYDPAGSSGETVGATHVSGVCALTIEIGEIPALIEAGETVKVTVRILNRGSDSAANVRATITVPAGMQLVNAQGPTSHHEETSTAADNASGERASRGTIEVQFAPITKIEPRADAVIELTLKARTTGAARLEVQAQCDQLPDPIHREEVTTIVSPQ